MSDSVSRQALMELFDWWEHEYDEIDNYIRNMRQDVLTLPTNCRDEWIPERDKFREKVLIALCDQCDRLRAVCAHYPCRQYTKIEAVFSNVRKGKNIADFVKGHVEFKCSICGAEADVVEGGDLDGGYFDYCPRCGVPLEEER